jgi:hypothetical protein
MALNPVTHSIAQTATIAHGKQSIPSVVFIPMMYARPANYQMGRIGERAEFGIGIGKGELRKDEEVPDSRKRRPKKRNEWPSPPIPKPGTPATNGGTAHPGINPVSFLLFWAAAVRVDHSPRSAMALSAALRVSRSLATSRGPHHLEADLPRSESCQRFGWGDFHDPRRLSTLELRHLPKGIVASENGSFDRVPLPQPKVLPPSLHHAALTIWKRIFHVANLVKDSAGEMSKIPRRLAWSGGLFQGHRLFRKRLVCQVPLPQPKVLPPSLHPAAFLRE